MIPNRKRPRFRFLLAHGSVRNHLGPTAQVKTDLGFTQQAVFYGQIEAGAYGLGKQIHLAGHGLAGREQQGDDVIAGQGWMGVDGLDLTLNLCLIFDNLRHGGLLRSVLD